MNIEKYYKVRRQKLSPASRRIFIEADYLIQLAKLKGDFFLPSLTTLSKLYSYHNIKNPPCQ